MSNRAYVTSIGEPTTELCVWSLERQGYDVTLVQDPYSSLATKLQEIYKHADTDFLRVDADVIPNRNVSTLSQYEPDAWWVQGQCFGWQAQDLVYGGVQFIRKEALPALRANIEDHLKDERPETAMFRLPEFHEPRRCVSVQVVCGLHGWGQKDQVKIKQTKERRGQSANYDWALVERMNEVISI